MTRIQIMMQKLDDWFDNELDLKQLKRSMQHIHNLAATIVVFIAFAGLVKFASFITPSLPLLSWIVGVAALLAGFVFLAWIGLAIWADISRQIQARLKAHFLGLLSFLAFILAGIGAVFWSLGHSTSVSNPLASPSKSEIGILAYVAEMSQSPEVFSSYVIGLSTILATVGAAIAAWLIGNKLSGRQKLKEERDSAIKDIHFLLEVESRHCEANKRAGRPSSKNVIRRAVKEKTSHSWSGKFTAGRAPGTST